MPKVGVEEELLLVDSGTGRLRPVAELALRAHEAVGTDDAVDVEPELFRHQIEAVTEPCLTLEDLAEQLQAGRSTVTGLAREAGVAAMVESLVDVVRPALEEAGDLELVQGLVERLMSRGGGATRQRRVFETHGSLEALPPCCPLPRPVP